MSFHEALISGCDCTKPSRFMSTPAPFERVPWTRPSGLATGLMTTMAWSSSLSTVSFTP